MLAPTEIAAARAWGAAAVRLKLNRQLRAAVVVAVVADGSGNP
jgi:hypothetical protein